MLSQYPGAAGTGDKISYNIVSTGTIELDQERTPMVCVVVNTQATIPKMIIAISAIFFAGVLAQAL